MYFLIFIYLLYNHFFISIIINGSPDCEWEVAISESFHSSVNSSLVAKNNIKDPISNIEPSVLNNMKNRLQFLVGNLYITIKYKLKINNPSLIF